MMTRILTIIDKEWAEVFKNRMVLFTIILMPAIFTIMPLVVLYATRPTGATSTDMADMPAQFARACPAALSTMECAQYFIASQFLLLFMVIPMMIPIAIAAYSIVGEKTTRSLEPLLATPISTAELLLGKSLAAVIPALLATWLCFGLFVAGLPLVGVSPTLRAQLLSPTWLTAILLIGALMAVAAVCLAVIVSSRVNDPRLAEQLAAVLIVPLLGVLFSQMAGLIVVNLATVLVAAQVLFVVDVVLVYAGVQLFQRERILTRWK